MMIFIEKIFIELIWFRYIILKLNKFADKYWILFWLLIDDVLCLRKNIQQIFLILNYYKCLQIIQISAIEIMVQDSPGYNIKQFQEPKRKIIIGKQGIVPLYEGHKKNLFGNRLCMAKCKTFLTRINLVFDAA